MLLDIQANIEKLDRFRCIPSVFEKMRMSFFHKNSVKV